MFKQTEWDTFLNSVFQTHTHVSRRPPGIQLVRLRARGRKLVCECIRWAERDGRR